jgi:hypothetical protein
MSRVTVGWPNNYKGIRYEYFPHSMSVLGHSTLEKHEDLTSRVNIYIAMATLIIQRIFQIYNGKNLKIKNKI